MTTLSRFISRLGEKGMPFYKLLKKVDKFQWTTEAQEALEALKKFLTTPPVLKPPHRAMPGQPAEDLLLYIYCTTHVVSTIWQNRLNYSSVPKSRLRGRNTLKSE
jgi:hypothetical protein